MADESNSFRVATFCFILTLLFLFPLPHAVADQSGVTIESDSINLSDFQTTDDDYYNLEFNLSTTNDGLGQNFIGQIHIETSAIDGTVLSNITLNYNLNEGDVESVSANLSLPNYGYTVITVGLSGDVGVESGSHLLTFQRTVHRLKPLNISIGAISSILLESVDSSGTLTGNTSLGDGDYVQFQIPIVNDGDYNWTGNLTIVLDNGINTEQQSTQELTITGMDTMIAFFNSSNQVFEGSFSVSTSLNGMIDDYTIDNYQNFTVQVNPPPLPLLSTSISYVSQELISGENLEITLTSYNNGTVDYSGFQTCLFNDEIVYDSSTNISGSNSIVTAFSIIVKPGELECYFYGQRIDDNSLNITSIIFEVESALFEYAGTFSPSTTDGPWHVGDDATFSLLVRNTGSKQGNVALRIESSSVTYQGDLVTLEPDQAGEVTITVPLLISGTQQLNWSLYTTNGDIADGINGIIFIPISDRQQYDLSLYDVNWDTEQGLSAKWAFNLSQGIDREMNLKLGYGSSSQDSFVYDVDMYLSEGQTSGSINFGFVEGDYVIIRAQEINWTAASSFSSFTKSIPQDRPEYSLSFNSQSNPNRPVAGESASVSLLLENKGEIDGYNGILILFDSDGNKLGESPVGAISTDSSQTVSFNFNWPKGDEVKLTAKWDFGGESITAEQNFLSTKQTQESSDDFTIPWTGILSGLAISALVILAVRIKGDSTTKPKKTSKKESEKPTNQLSDVKIEIGCPVCSRQLRVPENYRGSVKCPDCSNSFEVDETEEESHDDNQQETPDEIAEQKNDGKIEISCPECSQSLRIPESYDGSVRCPSCKTIFKSRDG